MPFEVYACRWFYYSISDVIRWNRVVIFYPNDDDGFHIDPFVKDAVTKSKKGYEKCLMRWSKKHAVLNGIFNTRDSCIAEYRVCREQPDKWPISSFLGSGGFCPSQFRLSTMLGTGSFCTESYDVLLILYIMLFESTYWADKSIQPSQLEDSLNTHLQFQIVWNWSPKE
jgi:hypothetical protein